MLDSPNSCWVVGRKGSQTDLRRNRTGCVARHIQVHIRDCKVHIRHHSRDDTAVRFHVLDLARAAVLGLPLFDKNVDDHEAVGWSRATLL